MLETDKISQNAVLIAKTLKDNGYKCYLVGGCIRDLLLHKSPEEWDLATDAEPQNVTKLFNKVVPTGIKYGTVTVILDSETFEVTTFRRDETYIDGRHPDNVKFTKSLEEDLSRRDFTINAMAFDPISEEFVDLFSGKEDLVNGIIRAVGDPLERFREDGLRPVRACRFAAQLDFDIEADTFSAIAKKLDISKKVSIERIKDEIVKALKAARPSIFFEYMRTSGLLGLFIPEISALYGVEQPPEYHKHDVYWHCLYACDAAPVDLTLRLAALLHDIAKPACKEGFTFYNHDKVGEEMVENILKRLKFSNEIISSVKNLVSNHMFNYEDSWKDSAVRRLMKRVGVENINDLFLLRRADMVAMGRADKCGYLDELQKRVDKIIEDENAISVSDLKINGSDVMRELGIEPGPKVGEILEKILEQVIEDPPLNEKSALLELLGGYKA